MSSRKRKITPATASDASGEPEENENEEAPVRQIKRAPSFTATLIEGKTYSVSGAIFERGVPRDVTAEMAEYLRNKHISITVLRGTTASSEQRPRFQIVEK